MISDPTTNDAIPKAEQSKPFGTVFQRIAGWAVFLLLLGSLPATVAGTLVPTSLGIEVSLWLSVVVAGYVGWEARDGGFYSSANPKFTGRSWPTKSVGVRILLMAIFAFLVTYMATQGGVFAVVTWAAGKPASRSLTILGTEGGGRGGCRHFQVREIPILFDRGLCAPDTMLDQATYGRTLTIFGKATAVGMDVERYELGPPP